jgi:hypothetical protein
MEKLSGSRYGAWNRCGEIWHASTRTNVYLTRCFWAIDQKYVHCCQPPENSPPVPPREILARKDRESGDRRISLCLKHPSLGCREALETTIPQTEQLLLKRKVLGNEDLP